MGWPNHQFEGSGLFEFLSPKAGRQSVDHAPHGLNMGVIHQQLAHRKSQKRQSRRQQKQLALVALLLAGLLGLLPVGWTHGGTNGLLDRMTQMSDEMGKSGELTPEQVQAYRNTIEDLRRKVDERIEQNGNINPIKDKDLYDQIDKYNKPLFDNYQKSKAKVQFDPRRITEDE